MSVRVNLLRTEEIEQSHSVNREAMNRMFATVGGAALAALLVFLFFQYHNVIGGHAKAHARFAAIENDFNRIKGMSDSSAQNHEYVSELDSWTGTRIRWDKSLVAIQRLVPSNIQLTRISVNGNVKLSSHPKVDEDDPGNPARHFMLRIEGKAQGALSDQDVIRFVDGIRSDREMQTWVSQVKLTGIQLIEDHAGGGGSEGDEAMRTFRLDVTSGERVME